MNRVFSLPGFVLAFHSWIQKILPSPILFKQEISYGT